jgi:hypothetical protein
MSYNLDVEKIINSDSNGYEDLVPLYSIDAHVEPVRVEPKPEPKEFLRVLGTNGDERIFYTFNPRQFYGEHFVDAHSLQFAHFMRNKLIDFVRQVAGHRDLSYKDLLQTGFEDITELMRLSLGNPSDLAGAVNNAPTVQITNTGAGANIQPPAMPEVVDGDDDDDESTDIEMRVGGRATLADPREPSGAYKMFNRSSRYKSNAVAELVELAKVLNGFGSPNDIIRVYRYLQTRQERYDYTVVKWLTLPMNLKELYFKDNLKAAVDTALNHVATLRQSSVDTLFTDLLYSTQCSVFAELVARYMDRTQWNRTLGDKRIKEGELIREEIKELAYRLRFPGMPDQTHALPELGSSSTGFLNPI